MSGHQVHTWKVLTCQWRGRDVLCRGWSRSRTFPAVQAHGPHHAESGSQAVHTGLKGQCHEIFEIFV